MDYPSISTQFIDHFVMNDKHSFLIDLMTSKMQGHLAIRGYELAAGKAAIISRRVEADLFGQKACRVSVLNRNEFGRQRSQVQIRNVLSRQQVPRSGREFGQRWFC